MNFITTRYDNVLDLLEEVIRRDPPVPTDLIICSTRDEFREQLLALVNHEESDALAHAPATQAQIDSESEHIQTIAPTRKHMLLLPTLQLLNASRFCNLAFCPTTTTLRGYLAGYCRPTSPNASGSARSTSGWIFILDILALHHGTSEFTLQGLSQTFATAVSAAFRTNRQLGLVECKDIRDPSSPTRGPSLWSAEVQLLSSAIKIGEDGATWGRRTVCVLTIAKRWFQVQSTEGKDEQTGRHHARVESAEEMLM
ncbi:hypothetical protein HRR80_006514 [Exophiala dermatitidis]|uniref:Uncharacterized protein n=2 Tax=Exophiala dermatitidis TaxID=5970 RepID=H6BKQ6_EXODN|nr:uncharacterized protein HMPREF1120_00899 [Exophiala dermatitidis NIH/UT8656]KAJ4512826.1 hypothetical protein HRR74_006524 [Exophiala dermatitidis]EHY52690.1 hypothetical protein HMPREF1120_00899 [Exophiala dermatitidis NIH/UT8656]KAJ4542637.1 hypothetical protein HRR77_005830 [Exophiala dermatitidis]KAJ4548325.1 hypothetical protein HRR76_000929 [Exophiala dermatitidis]KAJ4578590.1 hypothetical protein HRR79_001890 [Exophiala dermatitidis]